MKPSVLVAALCLGLCAVSAVAIAKPPYYRGGPKPDHDVARRALDRGEILSLSRIIQLAAVPGDIIEIELESRGPYLVYELKVLDKAGRVIEIEMDARTGRVLKTEKY